MTDSTPAAAEPRLSHYPITFFATVMGFAGLTLALHRAELTFGWAHGASRIALAVTVADFLLIAALYGLKALRFPQAVKGEWMHPVKMAFFPAVSISLLLIATAARPVAPEAARLVWLLGVAAQGALTLAVISAWISHRTFQPIHISPAWFIPAVGNVIVPLAGMPMEFVETSWLFFSAGMLFWIVLLTLVMNRLIFHDPLPARLYPTLAILIAPPAVGMVSWLALNGGVLDGFARVLFAIALVFFALVAMQVRAFARLPFALSWWALSFPIAALTVATLRYAELTGSAGHRAAGIAFLALLVTVIAGLFTRTVLAVQRGEVCQPE